MTTTTDSTAGPHQGLDQLRADHAWKAVLRAHEAMKNDFKEYVAYAKKLPAMISTNGLGQTLAFLASKAQTSDGKKISLQKAEGRIFLDIQAWILHRIDAEDLNESLSRATPDVLDAISSKYSSSTYMRATSEVQKLLVWLRMLAESKKTRED